MCGWCLSISSLLAAGALSYLASPALSAESGSTQKLEGKAAVAVRLWEYGREEFIKTTRMTAKERQQLERVLRRPPDRLSEVDTGMALLLALNCGRLPAGAGVYAALRSYRCEGAPLATLSSAAIGHGDLYVLAFVNPADRQRTQGFLTRYVEFWERETYLYDKGMPPGSLELTALREIALFLERGGYPPAGQQ